MARSTKGKADKCAAVVTIVEAPRMTAAGRKRIALWLRRTGERLMREGANYTPGRFTARYLYGRGRGSG